MWRPALIEWKCGQDTPVGPTFVAAGDSDVKENIPLRHQADITERIHFRG